jgi:hypothetical protein
VRPAGGGSGEGKGGGPVAQRGPGSLALLREHISRHASLCNLSACTGTMLEAAPVTHARKSQLSAAHFTFFWQISRQADDDCSELSRDTLYRSILRRSAATMKRLGNVVLSILLGMQLGCGPSAGLSSREEVQSAIVDGLVVGASLAEIQRFIARVGLPCDFDEFMHRYECLIEDPQRADHAIQAYLYVDASGQFSRAEVVDAYRP